MSQNPIDDMLRAAQLQVFDDEVRQIKKQAHDYVESISVKVGSMPKLIEVTPAYGGDVKLSINPIYIRDIRPTQTVVNDRQVECSQITYSDSTYVDVMETYNDLVRLINGSLEKKYIG